MPSDEFISVIQLYYQDELTKLYHQAMANYCSSLPAYIYSDKRPEPPKQEDYTLVTEEDIEMLDKLDKIKELAKHLIR